MATGFGLAMASPASAAGNSGSHNRWDNDYGNSYHYNHHRWNRWHHYHHYYGDRFDWRYGDDCW